MSEKIIALRSSTEEEGSDLIKENPPGQSCATCDFHLQVGIHKEGFKKVIICRRWPPTAGFFPGPLGRPVTGSDFPPTDENFWCGEWKQRASRVVTH